MLPIDSAVFATSSNRGTIIDSGTTLAYLAEEAYNPFVGAVSSAWVIFFFVQLNNGRYCFDSSCVISNGDMLFFFPY